MRKEDLHFDYPEELVAIQPQRPSRVLWYDRGPTEISWESLLEKFSPGDVLVVNETLVLKRRVFSEGIEILFIRRIEPTKWEVLFPSRGLQLQKRVPLPDGHQMWLVQKGRPQIVETADILRDDYFEKWGELPLPPYIQKARGARHAKQTDQNWYQTFWAEKPGSLAAPTAGLHFSPKEFDLLRSKGVSIVPMTLHVGLGTFLPVTAANLSEHQMHPEEVQIPKATWEAIESARKNGKKIWALGTTVTRSLESVPLGILEKTDEGFQGCTRLFILPGHKWRVVDRLMTNFHQPESTLLALVAAFSSLENVKVTYQWAIERKFRLFSYGDLTVWSR